MIREFRFIMGGGNLSVTLDGVPVYGISTDEHVILRVTPGHHVVGVFAKGPGHNEATVSVQAGERQRYYFRVETGSAFSSRHPAPARRCRVGAGAHGEDVARPLTTSQRSAVMARISSGS